MAKATEKLIANVRDLEFGTINEPKVFLNVTTEDGELLERVEVQASFYVWPNGDLGLVYIQNGMQWEAMEDVARAAKAVAARALKEAGLELRTDPTFDN